MEFFSFIIVSHSLILTINFNNKNFKKKLLICNLYFAIYWDKLVNKFLEITIT